MTHPRAAKRARSPGLIPNPLVKRRNLEWTLRCPAAADDDDDDDGDSDADDKASPSAAPPPPVAAIESGAAVVTDHLSHFAAHLSARARLTSPLLPVPAYAALYRANAGSSAGAHFVVHQHDHPVAGTHYDLRLQINATSSVSWAIMYGLPGDANSARLNRNATETRVHSLWNHLVETASPETGSLLIWDTGTYSVLPRTSKHAPPQDPSSPSASPTSSPDAAASGPTQQAALEKAFHNRKIRLRLHGSKLPDPYVLNLRLTKTEDASGRSRSAHRSTRRRRRTARSQPEQPETTSSDEHQDDDDDDSSHIIPPGQEADAAATISALDRELRELEDDQIRHENAYPGARNSIGSIHQRRWYLSLDRPACGFKAIKDRGRLIWKLPQASNHGPAAGRPRDAFPSQLSFPFHVHGPDHEVSVVTGRRGQDVLCDENVTTFVRRRGWAPVLN